MLNCWNCYEISEIVSEQLKRKSCKRLVNSVLSLARPCVATLSTYVSIEWEWGYLCCFLEFFFCNNLCRRGLHVSCGNGLRITEFIPKFFRRNWAIELAGTIQFRLSHLSFVVWLLVGVEESVFAIWIYAWTWRCPIRCALSCPLLAVSLLPNEWRCAEDATWCSSG